MVTYPNDWQEKTLGKITNILSAARVHRSEWKKTGIPFYRSSDVVAAFYRKKNPNGKVYISEELYKELIARTGILEKDDILITGGGSIGIPFLKTDSSSLYTKDADLIWIKHCKNFNSEFLYYFFCSEDFIKYLNSISHKGTIAHYTIVQVKNTPIKFPPLEEQKKIADTLSEFDEYIDDLAALIEKKKNIRSATLEDLMSRKIRLPGFCGDWQEKTLGEVLKIYRGRRLVRKQLSDSSVGKFPVYQNSLKPLGYYEKFNCQSDSTFIIAAGNAGDVSYSESKFWAADDCYFFEHSHGISQKFLYFFLLYNQFKIYLQTRRTSIPRLSRDILEKLKISLPPLEEQKAIAEILTAMDEEIDALTAEREKIISIREGAMEELLTGKIRLK